jgi:flagellar basal body-associated protein FliL
MTGGLYIWIMLAVFLGAFALALILGIIFYIAHWLEKKETGATHGFLELPHNLRPNHKPPPNPPAPPDSAG